MLFLKREDFLAQTTAHALGAVVSKEITRDFHIESVLIRASGTFTGDVATATADAVLGLVKNVRLTVADGARTRTVVDCSGRGLIEIAQHWNGAVDRATAAAKDVSTSLGAFAITYPIFCAPPQLSDPVGSTFLLPAPRYNTNPQLQITIASQADVDSNATPTFAISGGVTLDVIVNRRNVTDPNWETLDWELIETTTAYSSSATNQLYELQTPGSYTGILLRCYTSATARGDVSTTGGEFKLELLGNVIRRFKLLHLEMQNTFSTYPQAATGAGSYFLGAYYLDFLTDKMGQETGDLGSVLDANVVAGSGARIRLLQDIAGGSNVQIKYVTHRVFGQLGALKMQRKNGGA